MLLSGDVDPHDFEFRPADVKKVMAADLFIINGVGLEGWLGKLLKKTGGKKPTIVDTSAGIELLTDNPHIWLDPVNAHRQARNILDALLAADPDNAEIYRRNAAAYFAELEQLDADFRAMAASVADKNMVTLHDAFPYLAKRYGFDYLGYVEEFPEHDPRPDDLRALTETIRQRGVKVIFAETGYSPKLLAEIARQTGARVEELDTLETGEPTADAYLVGTRKNLETLRRAWQQ